MLFHQTVGDVRDDIHTVAKLGLGPPLRRSPRGRSLLQQTPARLRHRKQPPIASAPTTRTRNVMSQPQAWDR